MEWVLSFCDLYRVELSPIVEVGSIFLNDCSFNARQRHLQQENLLNTFIERFDLAVLRQAMRAVARSRAG